MSRTIIIRGAGDLASGVAHRLFRCGLNIIMLETAQPTVIRRTVAFASAVWAGQAEVEGVPARLAHSPEDINVILKNGQIAVFIDPNGHIIAGRKFDALVDAILAKKNLGTKITDAPLVVGLGPGFTAGIDVHAVIETKRGHNLGRLILEGAAAPDTGTPGDIGGYTTERIIRATGNGVFVAEKEIGSMARAGERVANVEGIPVYAAITGVVRGILKSGTMVSNGLKAGDVDPRGQLENCFTISEKARAIGGGVLEALLFHWNRRGELWI